MKSKQYDIFISYRREGGYDTAKHLYDLLTRDGYNVSFDIDTLRNGDFDIQLLSRIEQCRDFILIVDKNAFARTLDPNYNPKNDWLRCELAHALKLDKNIIPVFLSGVSGFPDNLPEDIADVVKKHGPEYNKFYFNDFYDILKKRFLESKSHNLSFAYKFAILSVIIAAIAVFFFLYSITPKETDVNTLATTEETVSDSILDNTVDISFYGKKTKNNPYVDDELYAKVDGYEYKIDLPSDICLLVEAEEDFDGDGVKDALITHVHACGGNGYGNSFFFVNYNGCGYFSISNEFGDNVYALPTIEDWKGQKSVVIVNTNAGNKKIEKGLQIKERYILKQGKAIRVEASKKNAIISTKEVKASDFHNGNEEKLINLICDLDCNGEEDRITCKYWERWDAVQYEITMNGKEIKCDGPSGSRIGLLASSTNGVRDLIVDEDCILKWDGSKYHCINED